MSLLLDEILYLSLPRHLGHRAEVPKTLILMPQNQAYQNPEPFATPNLLRSTHIHILDDAKTGCRDRQKPRALRVNIDNDDR